MSGSNRGIVFAVLCGLIVVCFGLGAYVSTLSYPQPERYSAYTDAPDDSGDTDASVTPENVSAPEHKQPCRNPESREESDLCAQWISANVARQNLIWTERHFWLGLATALGLGLTVILTLRAVRASERSLEHARDVSYLELRAYVTLGLPSLKLIKEQSWQAYFPIQNTGQTPATDAQIRAFGAYVSYPVNNALFSTRFLQFAFNPPNVIGPHAQRGHRFLIALDEIEMEAVRAGTACLFFRIEVMYSTYSGEKVLLPASDWIARNQEFDEGMISRASPNVYAPKRKAKLGK